MKMSSVQKRFLFSAGMLLSVILILSPVHALETSGVINQDSRWTVEDSPVHITGDLWITSGTILAIDPGVTIVFDSRPDTSRGYTLTVEGTLIAQGGEATPIVFTAGNREAAWGAIVFSDTSEDWDEAASTGSILSNCLLEYGGNHPGNGMIVVVNSAPLIAGNIIRFSSTSGIAVIASEDALSPGGDIQIINNRVHNNPTGLYFSGANGLISGNYFLLNGRAMNIVVRSGALDIRDNTIAGSSDELFGAGLLLQLDEPDNGIASYLWTQTSGPDVILENPDSARPSFIAPDPGNDVSTLTFDLTVTDRNGNQATGSTEVTVTGSNKPPVAAAGSDTNIKLSDDPGTQVQVTLNGAGSYDPDTGIADYQWVQESGPTVVLLQSDSVRPTFIVPTSVTAGEQATFKLTVTDDGGLQSTDTVDVRFYLDNVRPVSNAGNDITADSGQTIVLYGSGSRDPDGGITAYTWTQTGGTPVSLSNPNAATPSFILLTSNGETLTFSLEVKDIGGLTDTDEVEVHINGLLAASPGADQSVSAGDSVTLDGSGSMDRNAASQINVETNTFQWDNESAGMFGITAYDGAEYQLDVTGNSIYFTETRGFAVFLFDWEGGMDPIDMSENWWGTDDPALIDSMVYDNSNDLTLPAVDYESYLAVPAENAGSQLAYPPLANAGPDMEVSMDMAVTLNGSASYDPDGIAVYQWQQTEGPTVTLKDSDNPVASFVAPSGGTDGEQLTFTLTVMTDNTFSHTDDVIVTVNPDEVLPIVETGGSGCFIGTTMTDSGNSTDFIPLVILAMAVAVAAGLRRLRDGMKLAAILCFTLLSLFLSSEASAGYVAVGGGDNGDAEQYSITLETGGTDIPAGPASLLFAVGIPIIPHGDENLPENTIALSCPNDDCQALEPVVKGTETGLYVKLGIELGSSGLYLNAIGGATVFTESELTVSEATGNIYEEDSNSEIEPLYGGGLSLFLDTRLPLVIQVDYDTRRGVCGSIGWWW